MRLSRREVLKQAGLAMAALGAAPLARGLAQRPAKPNIIYILADDLGYGDLGCYGQKRIKTPNLDRMAAEGMRFTQHYAGSTVCAPSRCALMTGKHTGHCTVRGNVDVLMKPAEATIATVMKKAGYTTACIGKWGIGHPPPPIPLLEVSRRQFQAGDPHGQVEGRSLGAVPAPRAVRSGIGYRRGAQRSRSASQVVAGAKQILKRARTDEVTWPLKDKKGRMPF